MKKLGLVLFFALSIMLTLTCCNCNNETTYSDITDLGNGVYLFSHPLFHDNLTFGRTLSKFIAEHPDSRLVTIAITSMDANYVIFEKKPK